MKLLPFDHVHLTIGNLEENVVVERYGATLSRLPLLVLLLVPGASCVRSASCRSSVRLGGPNYFFFWLFALPTELLMPKC